MSETISAPEGAASDDANFGEVLANLEDTQEPTEGDQLTELEGDPVETIALKVNGKTIEKSLDEIKALAQKQIAGEGKLEAAKKQIEEAKQVKEQAEKQVGAVKQMLEVLKRGDFDTIMEFAENYLGGADQAKRGIIEYALKLYDYSKMSPQQREAVENKKALEKYKRDAEERHKQDQQRAWEFQVNQANQLIAVEVPKAIKEAGLPDSAIVREQIISTWRAALDAKRNPTPLAVAKYVKQRLEEAKMLNTPKQVQVRRKATPESVRSIGGVKEQPSQYMSFEQWQKTRGKR